jgi:hypothetical protein
MSETLTAVSQYNNTDPTIPEPGELGGMQTGPAPMKPVLQKIVDRILFARDAVVATLGWSGDFSVDPGGSASTFAVNVGAIGSVVLATSTGYVVRAATAATIGASKIAGGGNLGADSWYYVYAYESSGSVDYEIATTAPSAARRTKTGDPTRRYLGCFRTDSTGAPFPLRAVHGRYLYRRSAISSVASALASDGLRALNDTGTHAAASLDLSSRLPPHARVALLNGEIVATSSGTSGVASLNLFAANDTTAVGHGITANASAVSGDTSRNSSLADVETTSAQAIRYSVTNTGSVLVAYTLDVMGWCE